MLQETCENAKSTAKSDFLLVVLLVLGIVFARVLANLVSSIPYFGGVLQIVIFVCLVAAVYVLYKKRLCSYRYTIVYEEPAEDDLDQYGERRQWLYPLGYMAFERMVGDKGKVYELIQPQEVKALLTPTEEPEQGIKRIYLSVKPKATAYKLIFERNNQKSAIYFHPSDEFIGHVEAILNASKEI